MRKIEIKKESPPALAEGQMEFVIPLDGSVDAPSEFDEHIRKLIRQDTPSGRTMDFLTQELNREVNTIGSKCSQIEITQLVIEAKNEIERIREQIQNIE